MNTTNLFVELLLIGIGTTLGLALFFMSIPGLEKSASIILMEGNDFFITLITLAIAYVFGIVTDRIADRIFTHFSKKSQDHHYPNKVDILKDKTLIYQKSTALVDMIEYGRSRLRVCRGWLVNLFIIIITGNLYLMKASSQWLIILLFNLIILLFSAGLYFAWRDLTEKGYEKINLISTALKQK